MTGLEKILERIEGEARERASAILQRSEQECTALAREYAARAEQTRERLEKEGLAAIEAAVGAARAQSEKTHTEILQSTRRALLDEAFARAKKELCDNDFGKYRELRVALLVSALLEQHRAEQQSIAFGDEVEEFERFGPLVGLFCVVFLRELRNLPGTPAFVAQGPVFYLRDFLDPESW